MKKQTIITNLIDWSKSFVDENGSFYCGTRNQDKANTSRIVEKSNLVIYATDIHPITAPEHKINGGLYPVHNALLPEQYKSDFVFMTDATGNPIRLENKTLSPCLTDMLNETVTNRNKGIIVPRGVYFQGDLKKPFCNPKDIEDTFGSSIISIEQFLNDNINYVIAPKQYFDATRLDSDVTIQGGYNPAIPRENYNVFSLLDKKFPRENYTKIFVNTGVVEGICRLHTSIGLKQMFPFDRVINISDATTPLAGIGLGYKTPDESRDACMKVCKDVGIEYMSTENFFGEFK